MITFHCEWVIYYYALRTLNIRSFRNILFTFHCPLTESGISSMPTRRCRLSSSSTTEILICGAFSISVHLPYSYQHCALHMRLFWINRIFFLKQGNRGIKLTMTLNKSPRLFKGLFIEFTKDELVEVAGLADLLQRHLDHLLGR